MATADRPDGTAERDPALADDRGIRRDGATDRDPALADDEHGTRRDSAAERDPALADDEHGTRRDSATDRDPALADDDRTIADDRPARPVSRTRNGTATTAALETARARQRDEFGGINWGASFFGWLVAVGVAALLTALLAAAGAAIGLTATTSPRPPRTPRRSAWAAASRSSSC